MPSYSRWISKFEIKPDSWVYVPSEKAILAGKAIKRDIENSWQSPINYYHLRPGGHIEALKLHLKNTSFIHLDIRHFFGSINKSRVTRCVKKIFGYEKARNIAVESTVKILKSSSIGYELPFGFVQSPLLASLCLFESHLGQYLETTRKINYISISVYMDDIIISTKNHLLSEKILKMVKLSAQKSNFLLNSDKEEGPAEQITAFNINLSHKNMRIEEQRFCEFIVAHNESNSSEQKIGIENYIDSVNKNQSSIFQKWNFMSSKAREWHDSLSPKLKIGVYKK